MNGTSQGAKTRSQLYDTHHKNTNKGESIMKAKNNFSVLLAETTAKGSLAIFAGVAVFLGGFITWSAAGTVSGLLSLFN